MASNEELKPAPVADLKNPYSSPAEIATEPIPGWRKKTKRNGWSVIAEYVLGLTGAFLLLCALLCLILVAIRLFQASAAAELPTSKEEMLVYFNIISFVSVAFSAGVCFAGSSWFLRNSNPLRAGIAFVIGVATVWIFCLYLG